MRRPMSLPTPTMSQHHSYGGGGGGGGGAGGPGSELAAALIRRRRIVEGPGQGGGGSADPIASLQMPMAQEVSGMKNVDSYRTGTRQKMTLTNLSSPGRSPRKPAAAVGGFGLSECSSRLASGLLQEPAHMVATNIETPDWRREMSTYLGVANQRSLDRAASQSPPPAGYANATEEDTAPVPPPAAATTGTASMKASSVSASFRTTTPATATATPTMSAPSSKMSSPSSSFSGLASFHKCLGCQKAETEKASLRSQQQTMERELQSLRNQLYRAKTEVIDRLGDTLKHAYAELEATKTKLQEEQDRHKKTESSLLEVVKNNESYRDELHATRQIGQELQALKERLASAETAQYRLEEKNEHYQRELQSAADHPREVEVLKDRLNICEKALVVERKAMQEKLDAAEAAHAEDLKTIEDLRKQLASSEAHRAAEQEKSDAAQRSSRTYAKELEVLKKRLISTEDFGRQEREALQLQLTALEEARQEDREAFLANESSESRLRFALSRPGATSTEELQQAVGCVDALLEEGRRELANRELRDRRAAYEELHSAQAQNNEDTLRKALETGRRAKIDEDDLRQASNKLLELEAMSEGEKLLRDAEQKRRKLREMAFVFVKRDDVPGLSQLLQEIEETDSMIAHSHSPGAECQSPSRVASARWWEWKDHAQRTLLKTAHQLKSVNVQQFLDAKQERRQADAAAAAAVFCLDTPKEAIATTKAADVGFGGAGRGGGAGGGGSGFGSSADPPRMGPTTAAAAAVVSPETTAHPFEPETTPEVAQSAEEREFKTESSREPIPIAKEEEEEEESGADASDPKFQEGSDLWKQAFRSVVKDDTVQLSEVINEKVPRRIWASWRNKAGKDLITLSEERGSSAAYSLLAKAMGLLQERPREAYEDRDTVWIFLEGEVQPIQATVLEDTPAEADQIFVQFWVGEEPPRYVDRSMVFKINS